MASLKDICDEVNIGLDGPKTRKKLQSNNIHTFDDLLKNVGILDRSEPRLQKVVDWYHWFKREHGRYPDMNDNEDFNEEAFEDFCLTPDTVEVPWKAFCGVHRLLKDDEYMNKMVHDQGLMPRIQEETVKSIETQMSPQLKRGVETFDYRKFSGKVVETIYTMKPDDPKALIFVNGPTQSGKTAVKAVALNSCHHVRVPLVVLTKGVKESKELTNKLKNFVKDSPLENFVIGLSSPGSNGKGVHWKTKRQEMLMALKSNGTVVFADTAVQIRKIIDVLGQLKTEDPNFKCVIFVDECDAIACRTTDRKTQIEQEYDTLLEGYSSLTVMISATPVPLMLEVASQEYYKDMNLVGFFNIETPEEYCGINDMVPLKDADGEPIFLDPKEVSYKNGYTSANDALLIKDALQDPSKKGVLILDCTNPRVSAEGNVRGKAQKIQKKCSDEYGRDVVVMIHTGGGIEVLSPKKKNGWEKLENTMDVADAIEEIDREYTLDTPLFCFGFSKMARGISYRSSRRVPTHMVVALGKGHNVMNLVQAIGRATFKGKTVLNENGFQAVTLLIPSNDFITAKKLLLYVKIIYERVVAGDSLSDALSGANRAIPDAANFFRHTSRPISRFKRHRLQLEKARVEKPPKELSIDEKDARKKLYKQASHQRVLRTMYQCSKSHTQFDREDAKTMHDDSFQDDGISITLAALDKVLDDLVRYNIINLKSGKRRKGRLYEVKSRKRLLQFINKDLAYTEFERQENLFFDECISDDEASDEEENLDHDSHSLAPEAQIFVEMSEDDIADVRAICAVSKERAVELLDAASGVVPKAVEIHLQHNEESSDDEVAQYGASGKDPPPTTSENPVDLT